MPVKAWSYSAWALYDLCPLQYKLAKIDKIPQPQAPAMKRGNDIHVGVAAFISGKAEGLPQEAMQNPVIVKLIQEIKAVDPDYKQVEQQWGFTNQWKPTGWFAKDTWFRSVLDAGVMYDDMAYEDCDWKSGRRHGKSNSDQMETQALSVMCKYPPVRHVTTRLAYIDEAGDNPFEFAEFPATDKLKLAQKWAKKVEPMFAAEAFPPKPNDKCKWCAYSRSKGGQCAFG